MAPFVELTEDQVLDSIAELDRIRTKINALLDLATSAMVLAPNRHEPIEKPIKKGHTAPSEPSLPLGGSHGKASTGRSQRS